tara:strand:- start:589 stop:1419 length:831 start_codon:yes stop_codon:yes gene_type:complete
MKRSCTLLLQRNLPDVTEKFAENLLRHNSDVTDLYVVESGSDDENLTGYETFHANWEDAKINGLRTGRGFNFGLKTLIEKDLDYEFIMMATGDTQLPEEPVVKILIDEMDKFPKMGIISPIVWSWNERITNFVGKKITKAMYVPIPHICWMFRRDAINDIISEKPLSVYDDFLYDGTNFRCYGVDTELMMRMYMNDWMFCVTSATSQKEDYDLTDKNYKKMKTNSHSEHRRLMWDEGLAWFERKYGFKDKHGLNSLLRREYISFFDRNPDMSNFVY